MMRKPRLARSACRVVQIHGFSYSWASLLAEANWFIKYNSDFLKTHSSFICGIKKILLRENR